MRFIALITLLCAVEAFGATFVAEDEALVPVPDEVADGIARYQKKNVPTDYKNRPCKFIGKAVTLREGGPAADWVATTADACSWAASAAPVWVLVKLPDASFQVVLFHVTYDLTVGRASQNGLHHIATARATAARREDQLWKFDGKAYQISRMKVH